MIESLGILAYELLLELLLASAIVWVIAVVVIRYLKITAPAWLVRFYLLPIFIPVLVVPLIHLIIRPICPWIPSTPIEDFMGSIINISPFVTTVSLGVAGLILFSGTIYPFQHLAAAVRYRQDWRRQRHQQLPFWLRCNTMLQPVALRLQMSHVRLIVREGSTCGSLSLGPFGSYVVISKVMVSMLDDEELESLFAHELGHIKRKDTLFGVAVGVCHRLLAFSPFARSAYRSFCQAREELVDDLAIFTGGRPLSLASCLLKAYRLCQGQDCHEPSTGLLSSTSSVESRIRRLLENVTCAAKPPQGYRWLFFGVITVMFTVLLLVV